MPTALASIYAALAGEVTDAARAPDKARWPFVAEAPAEPLSNLSPTAHLVLPITIFVSSVLSITFANFVHLAGTLWASNAIILVALLRHRTTGANYAWIIGGGFAAMSLAGLAVVGNPVLSALLAVGNIGEIAIALVLLWLVGINASNLASFRNLLIFVALAGGVGPLGSATASTLVYAPAHQIPWPVVWRNWYIGHALGMIVVAPFLISITSSEWNAIVLKKRLPEAAAIFALFVVIGGCAVYFRPFIFVLAPMILVATIRFGLVGATLATFMTAAIASGFVIPGLGRPIVPQITLADRILGVQAFLAITSFWSLPTAALLAERDRLLSGLSRANARLLLDSERKSHLVVGLRRHLAVAEEKERLRLSHELHDQAGQSLIAAILELNEIDPMTERPARDRLQLVRRKMEDMGKTLHRIAWELRPPAIDELGLCKALSSYLTDWAERCGVDVDFHGQDPGIDEVPGEVATAVYRVVQEGLTNIVKHAQRATNVSVIIRRSDVSLQVIIEDNGCGFDSSTPGVRLDGHHGLGLAGMRERLLLVDGTLEIESAPGAGTTLFVRIALDAQGPMA